jgi:hypothetical protein
MFVFAGRERGDRMVQIATWKNNHKLQAFFDICGGSRGAFMDTQETENGYGFELTADDIDKLEALDFQETHCFTENARAALRDGLRLFLSVHC